MVSFERDGSCSTCGREDAEPSTPSFRCPGCDREIPDVTQVLRRLTFTEDLMLLIAESVARETHIIPFAHDVDTLIFASDFTVCEPIEKLRFILNRPVYLVYAETNAIIDAINRHFRAD